MSEFKRASSISFPRDYVEDSPSIAETEVSFDTFSDTASLDGNEALTSSTTPRRLPLQWEFKGLTLWIEFEEFDNDLTSAVEFAAHYYGTEVIPKPHATAIYGMMHLSVDDAREKLHKIPSVLPGGVWPGMDRPIAVKQDIAVEGRPGQVCSVAWAELTFSSSEAHEAALDELYRLFEMGPREGQWTPHVSLAYDNPEDSVLDLGDTISYVAHHPSLLSRKRKVAAISLWDTNGKLGDWKCVDRIHFSN